MRHVNWTDVTATTDGGSFAKLPAGPYVAAITDAIDNDAKQYVEVVFDIFEGEHKGYYSDEWGKSHPYAHHFFLSYKDTALGMLKGRLEAIGASNPGFDPFAAWDAGRLDMFRGRVVGVNLQEEEYRRNDGSVGTRLNVCQVVDANKVRRSEVKPRDIKRLDEGGSYKRPSGPRVAGAAAAYDDIPFD